MFGNNLKLEADLLRRCKVVAEESGYSSVEEFISHILERELKSREKQLQETDEELAKRLKGLGYIE
jgi:hypothetical protein